MAEDTGDLPEAGEAEGLDFDALKERVSRLIHGTVEHKKLLPSAEPAPDGLADGGAGESPAPGPDQGGDAPFTEEVEIARLAGRAAAYELPVDLDDLNDAIYEKERERYSLPSFIYRYQQALKERDRRRRWRPRFAPESPRAAGRLIGRLLGHIEAAMDAYLTDTMELTLRDQRAVHILAAARMGEAAARLGETVASLSGEARRIRLEYKKLQGAPGAEGAGGDSESEAP